MTKKQLIEMLANVSDDTKVTVAPCPDVNGWTNHIVGLGEDERGVPVLFLSEHTVYAEEVDIE